MTSEPEKPIPQCLAEQLGMLRTSLQDAANRGAWRHLKSSAGQHIQNIRSYIKVTPEIERDFSKVLKACDALADHIQKRSFVYSESKPDAQRFKQEAIRSIDDLRNLLRNAKPSEEALILRLPW